MVDLIDGARVQSNVHELWREVEVVAETGSTNDDLMARAAAGEPGGAVLVAEFQRAGRGRLDRTWEASAGTSLMFSMLLRPEAAVARWGWVPLLAGLGVFDALRAGHVDVALKWPNDVQLGSARGKCAGILAQATSGAIVVGIGMNVTRHDGLPEGAAVVADHWEATREQILCAVLNSIAQRYVAWDGAGGDAAASGALADYRTACGTLDQQVRVFLPGHDVAREGRARDIDTDGRLIVATTEDELVVGAGDVVHLRAL